MEDKERAVYQQFVRDFYRAVVQTPPYATADDYRRLLQPLVETAEALLGEQEVTALQKTEEQGE